jgi:hypothetical protein
MSTNRSTDRASLCSFMYVDCRHRPVSSRAQRRIRFRRRSGGLQTGQRDGRERTRCPVAPAFRGRLLFANPELSKGPAFRRRSPASTLAYLGQTLVQILPLAQHEYINAYGTNSWRETIRTSHEQSADHTSPEPSSPDREPEPDPDPTPAPAAASDASPASE